MRSSLRNNNAGMSLVEVLIAMVILAVISVPLIKYFTDSLEYSIKTAQKQHATAEAQALLEDLDAQDIIVEAKYDSSQGKDVYNAYYVVDTLGFEQTESEFFSDEGLGRVSYTKSAEEYDLEIIVDTNVNFNTTAHPVIYGVDDTKDVFAVETNQFEEALLYFQAVNSAYDATNEGNLLLDAKQIEQIMKKTIHVYIDKPVGGLGYSVQVYYEYVCEGSKWYGPSSSYRSTYLYQGSKKQLNYLYILYNRKISGIQNVADIDSVIIERSAEAGSVCPEVYLVCQNPVQDANYKVMIQTLPNQMIHSNIGSSSDYYKGQIKSATGTNLLVYPLNGNEKTLRMADITVNVYQKGTTKLYATMSTTKGE